MRVLNVFSAAEGVRIQKYPYMQRNVLLLVKSPIISSYAIAGAITLLELVTAQHVALHQVAAGTLAVDGRRIRRGIGEAFCGTPG